MEELTPQDDDDYDAPWKEAIREFFEPFMAYFFPQAREEIDWLRAPEFLDKELQQITRDAETGLRVADVLAKVWLKSGDERWVAIHVEVQGKRQRDFPERMYIYNFRVYDLYRVRVASLAIVTDESCADCPNIFEYEAFGSKVSFTFPVAILGKYRSRRDELERSDNPFSIFIQAHLETQDTKGNDEARFLAWRRLLRTIPKRGHSDAVFKRLLGLIDWLLRLPKSFDQRIIETVRDAQEEFKMPFVSVFERVLREEGRVEGALTFARTAVLDLLTELAGTVPAPLVARINSISDPSKLRLLLRSAAHATSITEFESKFDNLN